ncbi:chorismate mutase [Murdochiella vaginalis]|uniref:chorismate mutase n=1 Tax=Murdochiella vaginalis TaxID=1852373 RepID=UPI0008FDA421|nr:chorismate mutase [Murdochiella vaginalis]
MATSKKSTKSSEQKSNAALASSSSDTLESLRRQIDAIDRQMARLFEERMRLSRTIGAWKKATGKPVRDEKREAEMLASHRQWIKDVSLRESYGTFLQGILQLSRDTQHHDLLEQRDHEEGDCP